MPLAATSSLRRLGRSPDGDATIVARLVLAGAALVAFASLARGSAGADGSSRFVDQIGRVLTGVTPDVAPLPPPDLVRGVPRGSGTVVPHVPMLATRPLTAGTHEPVDREVLPTGRALRGVPEGASAGPALPLAVPDRWTVDAGRFAGLTIDLDRKAATTRPMRGSPFWRIVRDRAGWAFAAGWASDSLPVRLVLAHTPASVAVPSRDSVRIWEIVRELEAEVGRSLFRAAGEADLADNRDAIVLRLGGALGGSAGRTFVSFDSRGRLLDAVIVVASRQRLLEGPVLKHELVHALGFGHAIEPSSPMGVLPRAGSMSALDVARIQVWLALRAEQERSGAALDWPVTAQPR